MATTTLPPLPKELLSKLDISSATFDVVFQLPENIEKRTFFFVTDEIFENIRSTRYKNAVRCSPLEVELINKILKIDVDDGEGDAAATDVEKLTENDFFFEQHINCERCERQLNFYDVFLQGINKHGVGFMKWAMFGKKKVQMFPKNTTQTLVCSGCNHAMIMNGAYNHYSSGSYACT